MTVHCVFDCSVDSFEVEMKGFMIKWKWRVLLVLAVVVAIVGVLVVVLAGGGNRAKDATLFQLFILTDEGISPDEIKRDVTLETDLSENQFEISMMDSGFSAELFRLKTTIDISPYFSLIESIAYVLQIAKDTALLYSPTTDPDTIFKEPPEISSQNGILELDLIVDAINFSASAFGFNTRAYNGMVPGPTLRAQPGDKVRIRLINRLEPEDTSLEQGVTKHWESSKWNTLHWPNTTNLHTHGLHVSPLGNADNVLDVKVHGGEEFLYEYEIRSDHPPGMHWYHPHFHGSSALQSHSGMHGAFIIDPSEPERKKHNIFKLKEHFVIISEFNFRPSSTTQSSLHYMSEKSSNKLQFNPWFSDDSMADKILLTVNGIFHPFLESLAIGQSRILRFLYTGSEHLLLSFRDDSCTLQVIARDGIYWEHPQRMKRLFLVPATRTDAIVVCFSAGIHVLESKRHPEDIKSLRNFDIMEQELMYFHVLPSSTKPQFTPTLPAIPAYMQDLRVVDQTLIAMKETLGFPYIWAINSEPFKGPSDVKGSWKLDNVYELTFGASQPHPVHLHVNHMQIISYDGDDRDDTMYSVGEWRDTIPLGAQRSVTVRFQPKHFIGPAVLHCHITVHADLGMSRLYQIVDGSSKVLYDLHPGVDDTVWVIGNSKIFPTEYNGGDVNSMERYWESAEGESSGYLLPIPEYEPFEEYLLMEIHLTFAENYFTKAGERVFDVLLDGQYIFKDLDIIAITLEKGKTLTVSKNLLTSRDSAEKYFTIQFRHVVNNPLVNRVKIMKLSLDQRPFLLASPQSIFFENLGIGQSATSNVKLVNASPIPLTITKTSFESYHFSVNGISNPTLSPGQSVEFIVSFDGTAIGVSSDLLTITAEATEDTLTLGKSALVHITEITVLANSNFDNGAFLYIEDEAIDFGQLKVSEKDVKSMFLLNEGDAMLFISSIDVAPPFVVEPYVFTMIQPNSYAVVDISVNANTIGTFTENLIISSNAVNSPNKIPNKVNVLPNGDLPIHLRVDPPTVVFDSKSKTPQEKQFEIENSIDRLVTIEAINVEDSSPFVLAIDGKPIALPLELPANSKTAVSVTLLPTLTAVQNCVTLKGVFKDVVVCFVITQSDEENPILMDSLVVDGDRDGKAIVYVSTLTSGALDWTIDGIQQKANQNLRSFSTQLDVGLHIVQLSSGSQNWFRSVTIVPPEKVPGPLCEYFKPFDVSKTSTISQLSAFTPFKVSRCDTKVNDGAVVHVFGYSEFDLPVTQCKTLSSVKTQAFHLICPSSMSVPLLFNTYHDQTLYHPFIQSIDPKTIPTSSNRIVTIKGFALFSPLSIQWDDFTITEKKILSHTNTFIQFEASVHDSGIIKVSIDSNGKTSNSVEFQYTPTESQITPRFDCKSLNIPIQEALVSQWGPDGNLYIGTMLGVIHVLSFKDGIFEEIQKITTLSTIPSKNIVGIAFSPFETDGTLKMYVSHTLFYAGFTDMIKSGKFPYPGKVSILEGPDFSTFSTIISNLPTSDHDHGNGKLLFDNNGNLLITIGGNTNAGVPSKPLGWLEESPLSAAIINAEIYASDFDGDIQYINRDTGETDNDQYNGGNVDISSSVKGISVFASGVRSAFDIVYTTTGLLFSMDNGPNSGYGLGSTSMFSNDGIGANSGDEICQIKKGHYYGLANRNRAKRDPRQAVYYANDIPQSKVPSLVSQCFYTNDAAIVAADEYRGMHFGGALKGELIVQYWKKAAHRYDYTAGTYSAVSTLGSGGGTSITYSPGGSLFIVRFILGAIKGTERGYAYYPNLDMCKPVDAFIGNQPQLIDVFPWRAPVSVNQKAKITGNLLESAVSVSIGSDCTTSDLQSFSSAIEFVICAPRNPSYDILLDISVKFKDGSESSLPSAFRWIAVRI